MRRSTSGVLLAAIAGGLLLLTGCKSTGTALNPPNSSIVYNSIPNTVLSNVYSAGFDCCHTNELGDAVTLTRGGRLKAVAIAINNFACESGNMSETTPQTPACSTTPGATFTWPFTMNIYNAGSGTSPGSLIASDTQTFTIPYRPSADATNCPGGQNIYGYTFYDTFYSKADHHCSPGQTDILTFDTWSDVTVPTNVIITITYNTTYQGYSPVGVSGSCIDGNSASTNGSEPLCPEDSINVVTSGPVTAPSGSPGRGTTIGSLPYPNGIYGAFTDASYYQTLSNYYPTDDCVIPTEPGGGWGTAIALDNGPTDECWEDYHLWLGVELST